MGGGVAKTVKASREDLTWIGGPWIAAQRRQQRNLCRRKKNRGSSRQMEPRVQTEEEERGAYNIAACWNGDERILPPPHPSATWWNWQNIPAAPAKSHSRDPEGQVQVPMIRGGKAKKIYSILLLTPLYNVVHKTEIFLDRFCSSTSSQCFFPSSLFFTPSSAIRSRKR